MHHQTVDRAYEGVCYSHFFASMEDSSHLLGDMVTAGIYVLES